MKTRPKNHPAPQGSTLVIALCIGTIVGLVLGSCLYLVRAQYVSVLRSQHWHAALAVAEAGVEEALAHLNRGLFEPVNPGADGWTLSGGFYRMPSSPRQVIDGRYYRVLFTETMPPVIYSTGYVTVPVTGDVISRAIRVQTAPWTPFSFGLIAKSNLTLNGNDIVIASFDSGDPNHDNPADPNERKCNGNIAVRYGLARVGNADIYGALHMGPEATIERIGPNANITGGIVNDMNREIPNVTPPFTTAPPPNSKTNLSDGIFYEYMMGNGNYMVNGNLDGKICVAAGRTATLYVTGSAKLSVVKLEPAAVLRLYVGGPSVTIVKNLQINPGGNPYSFQLFGLPTLELIHFNGNNEFTGIIYAPNASIKLDGGGKGKTDVFGSVVINSATSDGHFCLYYDENLARNMPVLGYVAKGWAEF